MIEDALFGFFGEFQKKNIQAKTISPKPKTARPNKKKPWGLDVFAVEKWNLWMSTGNKSGRAADFIASLKLGVLTDFEVFFGRLVSSQGLKILQSRFL